MDKIIDNWWQVIALLFAGVAVAWGLVFAAIHFIQKAKESGVDEIDAGPVKVDFDKDK